MIRLLPLLSLLACGPDATLRGDASDPVNTNPANPAGLQDVDLPSSTQVVFSADWTPATPIVGVPQQRQPLASTPIVQNLGGTVFTVDADNGTVVRLDPRAGTHTTQVVGSEPTRLARAESDLYVTLRGDRSVLRLDEDLNILASHHVGAEPYGIVARPDGTRVYVTVSQQNEVLELDGQTLDVLARIPVPGEPRYLAITPDGLDLYVGSSRGEARLTRIDLQDLSSQLVELPPTLRGFSSTDPMPARLTGDFAMRVLPSGRGELAIPALYVDLVTPIPDLSTPEDIVQLPPQVPGGDPADGGGYGGGGEDVSRLNPAIVVYTLGEQPEPTLPIFVSSSVSNQFLNGIPGQDEAVRSYVTGLTYTPDGHLAASLEASSAVLLIDPTSETSPIFFGENPPMMLGFRMSHTAAMRAGPGAVASVWASNNEAYALAPFGYGVTTLRAGAARQQLDENMQNGVNLPHEPAPHSGLHSFGRSPLTPEQELGRQLFYSASNPSMGSGGVSCSTCHVDGRNDGLTWTFDGGPRQTPSLAGVVSDSAPVTWTSNVASVAMEADLTTRGRMGGEGLTNAELNAIEAFVDYTRLPDAPDTVDPDAVARGLQLFQGAGCGACHTGAAFSNNQSYTFRGTNLNTPRLEGIAGSAPYLFDGSAATLRDVLLAARDAGAMGSTAHLSDAELDDLEAYLRTL